MKCDYCHSEIPDGLQYCPFCGEVLELPAELREPEPEEEKQEETGSVLEKILVVENGERADSTGHPVDVEAMIDRAPAPDVYKEEAHKWNARAHAYEKELAERARGHRDPYYEVHKAEPDNRPLEQILAQKVADGEMTVQNMMSMLAVINKPEERQAASEETMTEEKPEEAPKEQEQPKGLFRKKEKTDQEKAVEKLEAEEFYQNTKPLVDDPLPPSPWIRAVKIILVIILIIIIVLGAIYYL